MCNYSEGVERRATARGLEKGHDEIREMNRYLIEHKRFDDLERASVDDKFCEMILAEMAEHARQVQNNSN